MISKNNENDQDWIECAVFEGSITIDNIIFTGVKKFPKHKFPFGFASIKINGDYRCYYAILVSKKQLEKVDKSILYLLMGDTPFILEYDNDSLIYLRTKLEECFFSKKELKSTISRLLEKGE